MRFFRTKGSAILTTIFLLFGILTIALIGMEIIMSGLSSRQAQGASARAFWAAETGIERAAMTFKSFNNNDSLFASCSGTGGYYLKFCDDGDGNPATNNCEDISSGAAQCLPDSDPNNKQTYFLNNNSSAMPGYWVHVKIPNPGTTRDIELTSRGSFMTTSREIYVKFCLPTCYLKSAGDPDGCGSFCK
jgi:hypothetical protein